MDDEINYGCGSNLQGCHHRLTKEYGDFHTLFVLWAKIGHLKSNRAGCPLHKDWKAENCWNNIETHFASHTIEEETLISMMATEGRSRV